MQEDILQWNRDAAERNLPFLLIGGHAVGALGYERATIDIDFLIEESSLPAWQKLLTERGYTIAAETSSFAQFRPPEGKPKIDLMMVNQTTWQKLFAGRHAHRLGASEIFTPQMLHLIALKMHSIRQNPARTSKDFVDVCELIRAGNLDVRSDEFREMVLRYAGPDVYGRLLSENNPD